MKSCLLLDWIIYIFAGIGVVATLGIIGVVVWLSKVDKAEEDLMHWEEED